MRLRPGSVVVLGVYGIVAVEAAFLLAVGAGPQHDWFRVGLVAALLLGLGGLATEVRRCRR